MQLRNIILAGSAALVLAGFGLLLVESQGEVKPEIDEKELEDALAAHRRSASSSKRGSSSTPTPRIPAPRRTSKRSEGKGESTPPRVDSSGSRTPAFDTASSEADEKMDLQTRMNDANGLYDRADYEGAREAALEILANNPGNVRMLRIVVSSSCIMAEPDEAAKYYEELPARDQRQMARRCKRYGVEFEENQ